ncbi:hypothetical protein JCM11641_000747 [Rhodosporidiobolus odoratus]
MTFEQPYRPRPASRKEIEQSEEQQQEHRQRFLKRRERERDEVSSRGVKLNYSSLSGVAFRDFVLGPSGSTKTRSKLDKEAYVAYKGARAGFEEETGLTSSLPRLTDVCVAVLATSWGETGLYDRFRPGAVSRYGGRILEGVRQETDGAFPFQLWLDVAARLPSDIPPRCRTYRDLCVSDVDELQAMKEVNAEAQEIYAQELARAPSPADLDFVPPFFLAYLDLTGEVGFGDQDIYKLKDPLSHFLAILKLDGTSVTDDGLAWIGRAANEPPMYGQMQFLSLRGLAGVTDEGVLKLAKLNLRGLGAFSLFFQFGIELTKYILPLDLRMTKCTMHIRGKLNEATLTRSETNDFWRPAIPRKNHTNPNIELQLFDSANYSPSRVLSVLHRLAILQHSPADSRPAILSSPLVKPLAVHLSSMLRRSAPSSIVKTERTAEDLYREHLSLHAGSTHATHHRSFGAVTSTMALSRKAVEEDGHAEGDRGAAFRYGNEGVAGGLFIGTEGKLGGGRASLYDVGTRKVSEPGGGRGEVDRNGLRKDRDPFSDTEDEEEREREEESKTEEAMRKWDEGASAMRHFYLGPRPTPRVPRQFVAAAPSKLLLIRHLPYRPPYEPAEQLAPVADDIPERSQAPAVIAGGTLVKKKRRLEDGAGRNGFFSPSPATQSPQPARPSRPSQPRPSASPAFSSSPASSSTASRSTPAPTSSSSNPFSKKRPVLSTPRHSQKNLVRTAAALPSRAGLTAFRTKK